MILTGPEIQRQVELGKIEISPFRSEQLNPASYDLRLGEDYLEYAFRFKTGSLDSKEENATTVGKVFEHGLVLTPGRLYLMHTVEVLGTKDFVTVIDGKSSIGRLGIIVHLTAGYGDPGFRGQYTLEVSVVHPVRVYAGMCFCQARFHTLQGKLAQYDGNYVGETARGPVASKSWRQFRV